MAKKKKVAKRKVVKRKFSKKKRVIETKNDFVVFMGVCESSLIRGDGILQDFYGVGELLLLPFFPQNLNGIFLLMGMTNKMIKEKKQVKIIIEDRSTPTQTASISLEGVAIPATGMARVHGFSKPYSKMNGKTICQNYDHIAVLSNFIFVL